MFENKNTASAEAKKTDISRLAHMTTLSSEEAEELQREEASTEEEGASEPSSVMDYMPKNVPDSDSPKAKKRLEHTEPEFIIAARPDPKTMYDFMFYHSYMSVMGVLSALIGLGAIFMVVYTIASGKDLIQTILFGAIVVMFLFNSPFALKARAKKQSAAVCKAKNTITYTFSDAGFDMARGEDEYADFTWDRMFKVKEGSRGYYMYLERNRAFLIPKADIEGDEEEFKNLLRRHVAKRLILAGEEKK